MRRNEGANPVVERLVGRELGGVAVIQTDEGVAREAAAVLDALEQRRRARRRQRQIGADRRQDVGSDRAEGDLQRCTPGFG